MQNDFEDMKIQVYPMDYEEFCDVTGNSQRLLNQIYDSGSPIGQATNRKLMRDLRIYMAVGGMPQAVEAYEAGKNFSEIDMVKRQIITLYEEDFKKNRYFWKLIIETILSCAFYKCLVDFRK